MYCSTYSDPHFSFDTKDKGYPFVYSGLLPPPRQTGDSQQMAMRLCPCPSLSFCPWRDSRSRSLLTPVLVLPPSRLRCYHPCESRNSLFGKKPPCLDHIKRFLFPGDSHLELPDLLRPFSSMYSCFSISQFLGSRTGTRTYGLHLCTHLI